MLPTKAKNDLFIIWFFLAGLILFQYFLFKHHIFQEISQFYPRNFDQAVFLPLTYQLFDNLKQGNSYHAIFNMITSLPTGVLFPVNALISFFVTGPSRFGALLPNLFYFVLLQIISFWTMRNVTQKNYFAFILLGLILIIHSPFIIAGGIDDFRMDFIAFCMYGIFTGLTIQSRIFLKSKWIGLIALTVSLMILMRFITFIYFGLLSTLLFLYFVGMYLFANSLAVKKDTQKQLINLILLGIIVLIFIAPFLILNKTSLYNYYVFGHITGPEKFIRGLPSNTSIFSWLNFYPKLVKDTYIGPSGMRTIVLLLFIFSFLFSPLQQKTINANDSFKFHFFNDKNIFVFLFLAIISPLVILTLDPSKSPIVGNIVTIPCLWLIVLFCFHLDKQIFFNANQLSLTKFFNSVGLIIVIIGLINQWHSYHQKTKKEKLMDYVTISKMYQDIGDYAVAKKWDKIVFSHDQIIDSISYACLKTLYFETQGKLINAETEILGATLFPLTETQALKSLENSKVVILTMGNDYPETYPFNQAVAKYRSSLIKYASTHFKTLGDYRFQGSYYRVYVKA